MKLLKKIKVESPILNKILIYKIRLIKNKIYFLYYTWLILIHNYYKKLQFSDC